MHGRRNWSCTLLSKMFENAAEALGGYIGTIDQAGMSKWRQIGMFRYDYVFSCHTTGEMMKCLVPGSTALD